MRFAVFLSIAAIAPLLVSAAQPLSLAPVGPWEVNYAENSCRLSRAFGNDTEAVYLSFESEAPGQVDMVAVGKSLTAGSDRVPARFLPLQQKPIFGSPARSPNGPGVLWSSAGMFPDDIAARKLKEWIAGLGKSNARAPALDLAREAQDRARRLDFMERTTAIEIAARKSRPVVLMTGSMGAAVRALDKCSRDSMRYWGIDPDVEDKIVRRPWAIGSDPILSKDDYPPAMIESGNQSDVKVRLLIDATGRPTKCTSLSHFKQKSFNDVVCTAFMRRAKFQPAELADGTKVPSYYFGHVRFMMY